MQRHRVPALPGVQSSGITNLTKRYSKLTKKEGCCVLTRSLVMPRKAWMVRQGAGTSAFLKKPARIWVSDRAIVVWTTSRSLGYWGILTAGVSAQHSARDSTDFKLSCTNDQNSTTKLPDIAVVMIYLQLHCAKLRSDRWDKWDEVGRRLPAISIAISPIHVLLRCRASNPWIVLISLNSRRTLASLRLP